MMAVSLDSLRTFDRVELHDGEQERVMTYEEFMAIPLDRRVRYLLSGRPRFYLGESEISRREALSLGR